MSYLNNLEQSIKEKLNEDDPPNPEDGMEYDNLQSQNNSFLKETEHVDTIEGLIQANKSRS